MVNHFKTINVTKIYNLKDWKNFIVKHVSINWEESSYEEVTDYWGTPPFPCVAYMEPRDGDRGRYEIIVVFVL